MSKMFILSGDFGDGKTATALSYVPPKHKKKDPVVRLVVDPEMRAETYHSANGDDPEKLMFSFKKVFDGRLRPERLVKLMEQAHKGEWKEKPHVIIIDDVAAVQEVMSTWWRADLKNLTATAAIYGKQNDTVIKYDKRFEPAGINFMKKLFIEFMLDLRDQGIDLVVTSPYKNVWQNYGKKGKDAQGLPLMRILGQSANVWDCWTQYADVIYILNRKSADGKLKNLPTVTMDLFIPKAALPGVPEQFEWPGWETLWKWHAERTHKADVSKLKLPEPEFSTEQLEEMLVQGKVRLMKELQGKYTPQQIKEELNALKLTYTPEEHEHLRRLLEKRWEQKQPLKAQ